MLGRLTGIFLQYPWSHRHSCCYFLPFSLSQLFSFSIILNTLGYWRKFFTHLYIFLYLFTFNLTLHTIKDSRVRSVYYYNCWWSISKCKVHDDDTATLLCNFRLRHFRHHCRHRRRLQSFRRHLHLHFRWILLHCFWAMLHCRVCCSCWVKSELVSWPLSLALFCWPANVEVISKVFEAAFIGVCCVMNGDISKYKYTNYFYECLSGAYNSDIIQVIFYFLFSPIFKMG